ncbi:hypothetical protein [Bradyrhizobium sp. SZCCHNR1045]|uniref:hypothetical protein n=1 Tax=Bradyrhizobium sp. SZCCHNR1045 TaxID=3057353 RepID=UPI002915CF96|nr:hypothetical protein [Bradyrhizobium sp. SZCCHNR1045]
MTWLAIIGAVGGIVGMIGGLVSLRDRFAKGRPTGSLTTILHGGRELLAVRIKNTTEHDIIVIGATERRGVYFLAEDFETGNLLRGQVQEGMIKHFMLKPTEAKELILMPKFRGGVAVEALGKTKIDVLIYWRRGNATSRPQLPIAIRADTQMLRRIAGVE